jgi:hypothetical protein
LARSEAGRRNAGVQLGRDVLSDPALSISEKRAFLIRELPTPRMLRESERSSGFGTCCGFFNRKVARGELSSGSLRRLWPSENVMQLEYIRGEIERMRTQAHRQRGEIRQLQRGISTASAEYLLERMLK